jgi:hypothetical protein
VRYVRVEIVADVTIEDLDRLRSGIRSSRSSYGHEVDEVDLMPDAGYGLPMILNDRELFGADQEIGLEVTRFGVTVEEIEKPFTEVPRGDNAIHYVWHDEND